MARSSDAADSEDVERRMDRWRQVVAKGDAAAFQRRLAWDGLTLDQTSVTDTIAAPRTAIEAVENTASTAVTKADAALKALTGEDSQ